MTRKNNELKQFNKDNTLLNTTPKNSIIIKRKLFWKTDRDIAIEKLKIPTKPCWLNFTLKLIRFYQRHISTQIWNRCVFDPSCSHYSELAFRKKGFIKGLVLTIKRLTRCKPTNGGIDELK